MNTIPHSFLYPLPTEARPLRDHWETTKFDQSLNGLSVSTQWSPRSSMILQWYFSKLYGPHGLHQILNWFKTVYSGLWGKRTFNERSAISQLVLNGLTSLSMISQESFSKRHIFGELSWSFSDLRWSYIASLSEISVGLSESAPWALNELSMVSARKHSCCCLLVSQRMLIGHSAVSVDLHEICWKLNLWSLNGPSRISRAFPKRQLLGGLGDCWEIWPSFGLSIVSQRSPLCGKGALMVYVYIDVKMYMQNLDRRDSWHIRKKKKSYFFVTILNQIG